jgi:hypothetical protein
MNPSLKTTLVTSGTICILGALSLVAYTVHKLLPMMTGLDDNRAFDRLIVLMIYGGGFSLMTMIIGVCMIALGVKYGEPPGNRS